MVTLRTVRNSLAVPLLLVASISSPSLRAATAEDTRVADFAFSSGFELFYAGPQWFVNSLPGSRRAQTRYVFDRAGDVVESTRRYDGYVGTLRDAFDVGFFSNISTFAGSTGFKTSTPTALSIVGNDYYWDVNGSTDGLGGTGTWDIGVTANWNDSNGTGTPDVWTNGKNAFFQGTAGTVTLVSGLSANAWNVTVGGYTFTGGDLTVGAGNIAISNPTGITTVNSLIQGTASLIKTGAGTLTLSGNNTYNGGTTVSAGLLQLNNGSALGSSSGSLTVNGGVLNLNDQSVTVGNLTGNGGTIWNNLATQAVTLTIGNGNNGGGNYAGVIADRNIGGGTGTGTVALTKTGTGTITLSGANTYTGATTVNGGTLLVTGSTASGSAVTVNNSGTLGGTGTVSGTVQVNSGGTLSPGTSPGTLTTGAVTLANGSTFAVDLTAGSGNDLLVAPSVTLGTILIGPSLSLNITGTLAMGQQFFIVNNTGANAVSGVFAQGATTTSGGYTFLIDYLADFDTQSAVGGNDIMLEVTAVPEPSTWIGAALALAALGFTQRRRFRGLLALRA